ncbi:MAG: 3-deoxy-manno-octulosonate cytidylyltransferase [Phycisphaerales bacterium]|jgi:3-deoxy-manno-octulosonate cytidylyltransferase (CMP-KDO synthetase)
MTTAAAIGVIPARMGSTRFPGKALAAETGLPVVVHVLEQARRASRLGRVLVAAPDEAILEAVQRHGGEAVLTREDHPNGTSRIAEAIERILPGGDPETIVVNIQGDEPLIDPAHIDLAVELLERDSGAGLSTLACPFAEGEDPSDPNLVKAVVAASGRGLYFSRACVPFHRDAADPPPRRLRHLGLYAYRRSALLRLAALPESPLERSERLEQLRALEHGIAIAVGEVAGAEGGIDTPEQYARFVARWRAMQAG